MNLNNLNEIIEERNKYRVNTYQWLEYNALKNSALSRLKPSNNEIILYFDKTNVDFIKEKYTPVNDSLDNEIVQKLYSLNQEFASRFTLEHNAGLTIHPIPYIIVKYEDKYFFILREKGSGETRLIGLKGQVGGHIGIEDKSNYLFNTIINGLHREMNEEIGVTGDMIKNIELKGLIKSEDNSTDLDHLGLVFLVELNTDDIKAEEDGILTGTWIDKKDITKHYESFESWTKILYDNGLFQ